MSLRNIFNDKTNKYPQNRNLVILEVLSTAFFMEMVFSLFGVDCKLLFLQEFDSAKRILKNVPNMSPQTPQIFSGGSA